MRMSFFFDDVENSYAVEDQQGVGNEDDSSGLSIIFWGTFVDYGLDAMILKRYDEDWALSCGFVLVYVLAEED
jgi:hypothetical protein